MKMDYIEIIRSLENLLQHKNMMRHRVDGIAQPQGPFATRHQLGRSDGIAAGKKRHPFSAANQFLGQRGNNSFRSAVRLRRDTFIEWRDLCNPHDLTTTSSAPSRSSTRMVISWPSRLNSRSTRAS